MKFKSAVLTILLLAFLNTAEARDVLTSKLSQPIENVSFTLDKEYRHSYKSYGVLVEYIANPGTYKSEYSGKDGIYLRGPENAVTMQLTYDTKYEDGQVDVHPHEGGILLNKSGSALIYHYVKIGGSTAPKSAAEPGGGLIPNLANAYLNSRIGKITTAPKMRPSKDLAASLRP